MNHRFRRSFRAAFLAVFACASLHAADTHAKRDYLAGNTVFIVRHAEKPLLGRDLTPTGEARAKAYIHYFEPFRDGGFNLRVNSLFAGADSTDSVRPRLTLEPLSYATGLALDSTISTKDPAALVTLLRTRQHGDHPLVAWRHGSIPALLSAFGASPSMLPDSKWPNDTYDWVIVLSFDRAGQLRSSRLIHENLTIP